MGNAVIRILTLAAVGTAAACLGSATASAADPVIDLDQSRIGLRLTHDETAAVGDGPIPALVTKLVPLSRIGAGLHSDTAIYRDAQGGVHASLRQVVVEAADHPDGTVTVYLNAPGTRDGRVLDIYQSWTR